MDKNIEFSILKVGYVDEYSHLEYIHSTVMCKILQTNSQKLSKIDDYLGCFTADFQNFSCTTVEFWVWIKLKIIIGKQKK